jgi:TniQ
MLPDQAGHALPYCPRPKPEEAAYSWLTRVAKGYGLSADRLLGQVIKAHNSSFCLERAFEVPYVHALSKATRIPRRTLKSLQGAPINWILQDRRHCNVCIRCLDTDILAERDPFLRLAWRHAWKTRCAIHGTRLQRTNLQILESLDVIDTHTELHRLRTLSTTFETRLDQSIGPSLRLLAVLRAVDRIESAIDLAMDGYDPDRRVWGFISAADFLKVVQDITTWALSNFECFAARPEAENLPNGVRSAAGFYFTMMPRRLLPFASGTAVRTLRKTTEPGLRAAALWLAEALLAKQEAYIGVETVDPPARQWRLLKRRTPTGLYWLQQKMAEWPRRYVRHQWMDLNSILALYR